MHELRNQKLLNEVYYYPDYMSFSLSDMKELLDSFVNIFKSIWSSIKLAWATIELNLKVVVGTWTKNKQMINDAFSNFQTKRQKYDKEMSENLEYFKKYYLDSRLDTLGGFGPGVLALAANPALFLAGKVSTSTIQRGTGEADPYSTGVGTTTAVTGTTAKPKTKSSAASPRLNRALEFFGYNASLLAEQVAPITFTDTQEKEIQKMKVIAADYVKSETENSKILLSKISNVNAAIKELLDAKTFEELVLVMRKIDQTGIKMSTQGIQTASKNIRAEFEKQMTEDPEKFKEAVKLMQQRAPGIKDSDPIESAMKFVFGISKTKLQQQLIVNQEELQSSARGAMNLPLDSSVRATLQQSEIGKQYLMMVDDFERKLIDGERETQAAKKSLKSAIT